MVLGTWEVGSQYIPQYILGGELISDNAGKKSEQWSQEKGIQAGR